MFSPSLSIARKYSILQQTGGDTSILRTVYLIGLFSRDIAFRRLSILFFNYFLTGIASLNITAHNVSHRKGTQIRFLRFFQNHSQKWKVFVKDLLYLVMNTHGPLGSLADMRTITLNLMRILRAIIFGVSRIYSHSPNNSIHKTRRLSIFSRTSGLRYRCWYTPIWTLLSLRLIRS